MITNFINWIQDLNLKFVQILIEPRPLALIIFLLVCVAIFGIIIFLLNLKQYRKPTSNYYQLLLLTFFLLLNLIFFFTFVLLMHSCFELSFISNTFRTRELIPTSSVILSIISSCVLYQKLIKFFYRTWGKEPPTDSQTRKM